MLNPEVFVSTILQSSITGAGLLFAIFGIIIPILPKLLRSRLKIYKNALSEFSKEIQELEKKTPNHFGREGLISKVEEIEEFKNPLPFTVSYVLLVFSLFTISAILCTLWYFGMTFGMTPEGFLNLIGLSFIAAVLLFAALAFDTIKNIFKIFEEEYKDIKEDAKEYKEILKLSDEEKNILKIFYKKSRGNSGMLFSLEEIFSKKRIKKEDIERINRLKMLNLIRENHRIEQKEKFSITEYGLNVVTIYFPKLKIK